MGTYTVYRLTFKTQLHLGRTTGPAQAGSLSLENTETYIPADTLFSAICQMWATFYDIQSLTAFLDRYTTENDSLPFTLTSAFPFAQNIYLFPKPMTWTDRSKESKRIQFVSYDIFQDIVSGNPPQFDIAQLITGDKVWMSAEERKQLKTSDDENFNVWTINTRPRVTLGSLNSGSEIWHVQTVQFNTDCGLWFAAKFDCEETQQKIETLLRVLGDCGIGGERNAGYGQFDFQKDTIDIPTAQAGDRFVTLSPICPKSSAQLEQMLLGDTAYLLNPSTGWITDPGSTNSRKRINLFAEGSVLHATDNPIGRLVDLQPDGFSHPVYRYGYAWQVGIKGAQNEAEIST